MKKSALSYLDGRMNISLTKRTHTFWNQNIEIWVRKKRPFVNEF